MDKQEFIKLLNNPSDPELLSNIHFEKSLEKYPYFNTLHMLAAKKGRLENSKDQNDKLFNAALYTCDRKQLYYFIETDSTTAEPSKEEATKGHEISPELIEGLKKNKKKPVEESAEPPIKEKPKNVEVQKVKEELPNDEPKEDKAPSEHSFTGWLKYVNHNKAVNPQPETQQQNEPAPERVEELDEQLKANIYEAELVKTAAQLKDLSSSKSATKQEEIDSDDKIEQNMDELARKSSDLHQGNITQTLAGIFEKQHKYTKAIEAYEFLSLKYPEKSTFFAEKIKNIKSKL